MIGGGGTIVMVNRNKDIVIPRPMKDGICGASGELLQILVLYPVESIKVRVGQPPPIPPIPWLPLPLSHQGQMPRPGDWLGKGRLPGPNQPGWH